MRQAYYSFTRNLRGIDKGHKMLNTLKDCFTTKALESLIANITSARSDLVITRNKGVITIKTVAGIKILSAVSGFNNYWAVMAHNKIFAPECYWKNQ